MAHRRQTGGVRGPMTPENVTARWHIVFMPKRVAFDRQRLERILRAQYYVISRQQALSCRVPRRTLDRWTAPGGRWQRVLPGAYAAVTGKVTPEQRIAAALLYAGPDSVITGAAALRLHRMRPPGPDIIDVLIPATSKRQSTGFVRVHRTTRMPGVCSMGPIKFACAARAAADAARSFTKFDDVRDVVSQVVQARACSVEDLIAELHEGPSAGSLLLSAALAEICDGVRSVAEADLRKLIAGSSLPPPMFNARLYTLDGEFIAMVDGWWDDAGVAVEVDSRAYHLSPADQDRDAERHDKLVALGVLVQHFSPRRVKTDSRGVIADLSGAIAAGRSRPRLPIVAVPADATRADAVQSSGKPYVAEKPPSTNRVVPVM
jgi:hypothetical protein